MLAALTSSWPRTAMAEVAAMSFFGAHREAGTEILPSEGHLPPSRRDRMAPLSR